jgi:hypothetical protein
MSCRFTPTMLSLSMLTLPPVANDFSAAAGGRLLFPAVVVPAGAAMGVGLAGGRAWSARTSGTRPPNDSKAAVQNGLQRGMRGGIIMGKCVITMRD